MSDNETVWMDVPNWAWKWKRLVLWMFVAWNHAQTGSLLQGAEDMRQRQEEEALAAYRRALGPTRNPAPGVQPKAKSQSAARPHAKGKALSRSRVPGSTMCPDVCQHLHMSNVRGNRTSHWVTCLDCASRWEATLLNVVPPQQANPVAATEGEFQVIPPRPAPSAEELRIQEAMARLHAMYMNYQTTAGLTPMEAMRQLNLGADSAEEMGLILQFTANLGLIPARSTS